MAATATARTAAAARRAPARKTPARTAAARSEAAARRAAPARRRRTGQTPIAGFVPVAVGRTAGAVGGIADSGLVVRLTRSRLWIGLLGGLLVGIVALNVMALSFSASSSDAARQADEIKRQNSALRGEIATRLSSPEIQAAAAELGLLNPEAGSIRYLRPSSDDAAEAARRLRAGELSGSGYVAAPTEAPIVPEETVPLETTPVEPVETAPVTDPAAGAVEPEATVPEVPVGSRGHGRHGPRRRRRRGRAVSLIDRRVGLLFASFVLLLALVLVRAAWVQGINGGSLSAEAQSQQVETVVVPGSRGTILDRTGKELAVSEDAATVFATPYQVEDPEATAHKLAKVLDGDQDEILASLADRDSGFAYIERKADLEEAAKIGELDLAGIGMLPDSRRIYPQGELGSQLIGTVGIDNEGLTGLEASQEEVLHGTDGEREVVRDALGDELERNTIAGAQAGEDLRLTIDASLQAETERVLAGIGSDYQPDGATAVVMDPRSSRGPGDGEPAGLRPGGPGLGLARRAAQHGDRVHLRAGLDLQGVHGGGRARGRRRHPADPVRPAADPPGRRPGDRGVAPARLRDALGRRHPRPVLERRRGQGRARAQRRVRRLAVRRALRFLGPALRLRRSDRDRVSRARSRGSWSRPTSTRARRWATCRSARASR